MKARARKTCSERISAMVAWVAAGVAIVFARARNSNAIWMQFLEFLSTQEIVKFLFVLLKVLYQLS